MFRSVSGPKTPWRPRGETETHVGSDVCDKGEPVEGGSLQPQNIQENPLFFSCVPALLLIIENENSPAQTLQKLQGNQPDKTRHLC